MSSSVASESFGIGFFGMINKCVGAWGLISLNGTFTLEWDKDDPQWSFLNGLTSKEITAIIENAITMDENGPL